MAISDSKKPKRSQELELLKSDVVSFASSIDLSSSLPSSSGDFDDSDFRKTSHFKPNKKLQSNKHLKQPNSKGEAKPELNKKRNNNERPKPRVFQSVDNSRGFDKLKNLPKLPLMKLSSMGIWHVNEAELEEKVISKKKVEFGDLEEWKKAAGETHKEREIYVNFLCDRWEGP